MTLSCRIHLWLVVLLQVHRQSCWANCGAQKTEHSVELEVTSLCSHSLKECGKTIFKDMSINYRYRLMLKNIKLERNNFDRQKKEERSINIWHILIYVMFGGKTCLQNTLTIYLLPIFFGFYWWIGKFAVAIYVKNDNSCRGRRCFKMSQARNKLE